MDFMSQICIGASKTFSVTDDVSIKSRYNHGDCGQFDEDGGFRIHHVPEEFRTQLK
jgi:hypothetical protein|tara:strand:+ start:181 stop:348 length:168 start_codon:yes stop_codon:yes gene_type:complete